MAIAWVAAPLESQPDTPEEAPMTQHVCHHPAKRRSLARRHEDRARAINFRDLSQYVTVLNRWIILLHTIASGNQEPVISVQGLTDDAMNEKTVPSRVQHDLPRL